MGDLCIWGIPIRGGGRYWGYLYGVDLWVASNKLLEV